MPVDVGGMIIFVGLYLLGLFVVFPIVFFCCKEGATQRVLSRLFAVYFFGPIVLILTVPIFRNIENSINHERHRVGEQKNLEAFTNYCKGRKKIIHGRISQEVGVSLLVRRGENFIGDYYRQFSAYSLFAYFWKKPDTCVRSGVKILEGVFPEKYIKEEKRWENEVRSYVLCTNEKWTVIPDVDARFELVFGQTGSKDSVPFEPGLWWMSNSSIQIADRLTGEILAEDTMYFLRYDTGVGGCPDAMEQVSDLLTEVFGHR